MTPVAKPAATPKAAALKKPQSKPVAAKETKDEGPNGSTRGMTWGLPLHQTFKRLLKENFKNHWDDEKLIDWLLKEFPNRENKNILRNIREIRWRYNFGKLDEDKEGNPHAPAEKAVRYNTDGSVYMKAVKAGMSEEEKAMKIEERRELEIERRKAEVENIAKLEERLKAAREKMKTRQDAWEERNGKLPGPEAEEKKPVAKKPLKIARK